MNVIQGNLNWGFSAQDLLNNSLSLYASVAGIVMLVLALAFAPMIVNFIKGIFNGDQDELVESYTLDDGSVWHYVETDERGRDWYQSDDGSWEHGYYLKRMSEEGTAGWFGD